jgi:hypothetical protein
MRCSCCNRALNDYESTMKHAETGDYLDTCTKCLQGIDLPVQVRSDLNPFDEADEYDEINDDFEEDMGWEDDE